MKYPHTNFITIMDMCYIFFYPQDVSIKQIPLKLFVYQMVHNWVALKEY